MLLASGLLAYEAFFKWWWLRGFEVGVGFLSMLGEWIVAYVIYREVHGARKQLEEDEKARKLTAALEILGEFSRPEMAEAMRGLFRWQRKEGENFVERFTEEVEKESQLGDQLDNWHRFTYRYFQKVHLLCEEGLGDSRVVTVTLHNNPTCYKFLNDVLRPLHRAYTALRLNQNEAEGEIDPATFDCFLRHYKGPRDTNVS
jgi:hypothetical protein